MQHIEQQAQECYQKNSEFLQKYHPEIYTKLQHITTQNYDLEYLDGYFDVKQLSSGFYLYQQNSYEVAAALADRVNFQKDSNVFEGFPLYYGFEKYKENFDDKTAGREGLYPLMTFYLDHTKPNDSMKEIEKFIFIGVGLATHIPTIHNKIKARSYLIIEDDLELFHLSLFVTPYYEFHNIATLYFSIAEDENRFSNTANKFLEDSFYANRYLKYSLFPAHSKTKIKYLQNILASQDFITFPYRTLLTKYLKPLEFLQTHRVLNLSKHLNKKILENKPILVLGAGPSFTKHLEWLKIAHEKFIIISVASLSKTLSQYNIHPDIILHIDGFASVSKIYEGFNAKTFLEKSIKIFGPFTPTDIREHFTDEKLFMLEENTYYHKDFFSYIGSCVGSTAILDSILLNAQDIYLLGTDFAIDQTSGESHSSTHITKKISDLSKKDEISNTMSFRGNLFPVKGNFTKKVYTNSLFHTSLQALYNLIPQIKEPSQNLYNLNDGAAIFGTIPFHIEDITLEQLPKLNKTSIQNKLIEEFQGLSKSKLSKEDILSLKKRIEYVDKILNLIQIHKETPKSNPQTYLYSLLGLVSDILKLQGARESNNIITVYYSYFHSSVAIIMDLFNTQELKNEKRLIKKVDKFFINELIVIATIYKKTINSFLETL